MPRDASNPLLLTPGPVSISLSTKMVMLKDRASGGVEFQADLKFARDYMVGLVGGQGAYTAKAYIALRTPPFTPATTVQFETAIRADPALTHVMVVHCETSTGVLNPLEALADSCRRYSKGLLSDAVASIGALDIDAYRPGCQPGAAPPKTSRRAERGSGWSLVTKTALENRPGTRPA